MASIEKATTSKGDRRYRVRWRVDGRLVERWAHTLDEARALKTKAEADARAGVALDPKAGARRFGEYSGTWLKSRLVRGRPLSPMTLRGYSV